jgi:large conductance mechanosensitive channel
MGMLSEFKKFAMRGNVLDMAIGIIIGGAFGKIITSFVNDVIMPPIGLLMGNMDFSDYTIKLRDAIKAADGVTVITQPVVLRYGAFITTVIDFTIVAFAIFLLVKQLNRFAKSEEPAPVPTTKECPKCFSTISVKATRCPNCTSEV